jgi:hypothetical protein
MNTTRRNRRQDAPAAQDAQVQEPAPEAQDSDAAQVQEQDAPGATATEDAPAPAPEQEPAQEQDGTQVPDAPAQEPAAEQEPQEPAQPGTDAPDPDAPAQEETPGDSTTADVQGAGEPAAAGRAEPTAAELLAIAASPDLTVPQDFRESAFASAAVIMLRGLLGRIAELQDDQPVTGDWMRLQISGANGRGVAGAKAALQVIVSMFGHGHYEGSTHGSIKSVAERRMQVTAFIPDLFRNDFAALMRALNEDGGVVYRQEQAVRRAQQDKKKLSGLPAGMTEYGFVNVPSRKAMVACGERIATAISSAFPADDPQVTEIRKAVAASVAAGARQPGDKNAVRFQATAKYAVAVAPETAQVLAVAQA